MKRLALRHSMLGDRRGNDVGAVVQLVEYRTRNREVAGSTHTSPGPLQATLSKLLTYCVLGPTQPSTLSGTGNE